MNKTTATLGVIIVVLLGLVMYSFTHTKPFGTATDCIDNTCLTSLYVTPGTLAVAGATSLSSFSTTGDGVVGGGTLNVTTSNTATSTIVAGCWEFYATSTATAMKFQASTTPGIMYSQYGSCPRL